RWLDPYDDELVISKQYPSAFFGTSLASTLTAMGVDNVLLTGLTTSGCIRASCIDSMSHGFRTCVIEDACGDRHSDPIRRTSLTWRPNMLTWFQRLKPLRF